jgi:hypothetical protein
MVADGSQVDELARLEALGARVIDDRRHVSPGGWVVLAYPEGNEFDLERRVGRRGHSRSASGNRSAGAGPHFPGWLSCAVGRRIVNLFFRPNEPWYHAGARYQHPVDGVAVKKARGYTIWAFRSRLSRLLCAGLQLPGYALQAVAEALRLETAHQMRRGGKGCVSGGIDATRAIFELGSGR